MESTSSLVRQLTEQPLVRDLPVDAAQAVLALRYCILCRRSERDPMPELERRWGNILAARRYRLVVEAIGHSWPDPFAVPRRAARARVSTKACLPRWSAPPHAATARASTG
ncbi:hypothetical protein [Sphingopyxis sp. QXT-31]|uniref:hypothetical protein n=1 Tax=Sphingopyxis sp. QXT-31 TaxID=1357916 RepID=UPI001E65BF08|nr:hypothetical protein [Sphingopyxis sp. QXT-31]